MRDVEGGMAVQGLRRKRITVSLISVTRRRIGKTIPALHVPCVVRK
jgi:hypothetical protein